jgi:hypothetical protein
MAAMNARRALHAAAPSPARRLWLSRLLAPSLSLVLGALAGCPGSETSAPKTQTGEPAVTNASDPWAQARAIAEKTGAPGLARWTDDLPYLFQAKGTRGVLVHKGAVVTATGPAAAGAYLRDIGILDGKGPSPASILTLLYVLRAFPTVPDLPEQSAIDDLGPEPLRPRVELAGGRARVILHYRLPGGRGPSRGTVPLMRETLDIGPTGDAAWTGEQIEHPLP